MTFGWVVCQTQSIQKLSYESLDPLLWTSRANEFLRRRQLPESYPLVCANWNRDLLVLLFSSATRLKFWKICWVNAGWDLDGWKLGLQAFSLRSISIRIEAFRYFRSFKRFQFRSQWVKVDDVSISCVELLLQLWDSSVRNCPREHSIWKTLFLVVGDAPISSSAPRL